MITLAERFWSKVDKSGDCWLWTAALNNEGYGVFFVTVAKGKYATRLAHRIALELSGIEVPEGLEPDHLCRTSNCVRPDHLELVTHQVNMVRAYPNGPGFCRLAVPERSAI